MRRGIFCLCLLVAALLTIASGAGAGQRRAGVEEDTSPMDGMNIEEMRAYQSYFYAPGGRDPLVMRFPTDSELGIADKAGAGKIPTREEQEAALRAWLKAITDNIKAQKYDEAIEVANEAINRIDNEWPPLKPEYTNLIRMNEEIRNYGRMASRLKSQQDIGKEFVNLGLRVDGVIWSPMDAKAVVNGTTLSAGEIMLHERKQGDLRVEVIEEHGVVFQFKGMRFRLPVEVYAPPGNADFGQ